MTLKQNKDNIWHFVSQDFSFDCKLLHAGLVQNFNHKPANTPMDRYVLAYLFDGEGSLEMNGKLYALKKGDLYLIPPTTPYTETNSATNPYAYYCVAFYGGNCKTLLARAGLSAEQPVLSLNDKSIEDKMREIFELCKNNTFISLTKANVALFQLFCLLYERRESNYQQIKDVHQRNVELAQAYVHEHYQQDITTTEICKHLQLSRSYFCEIFKKVAGISLKEYIIYYRINEAMRLLIHSDLPSTKIAEKVGFNDYANFYRCFKTKTGKTPRVYRLSNHPMPNEEDLDSIQREKRQSFVQKENTTPSPRKKCKS